jgi:hypothetical protein
MANIAVERDAPQATLAPRPSPLRWAFQQRTFLVCESANAIYEPK